MDFRPLLYISFLLLLLAGCSAEKNTITSKAFHNMAAHYNGYFYGKEELQKVERGYQKSITDDYNRILRLYPSLDSNTSKKYDKELQEVVKMASLAIQRHQNSKWVDDCYILIGKARMYGLDWGNAVQTFKYVNTNSKDKDARHEAILSLMHTFTEHEEFNNARAAGEFLDKEKLTDRHHKHLFLEKAYLAQVQNDLDGMIRNLTLAAPLLRGKKDRPGRVYFIMGQVYQKLGFESEAYDFYKKCLSTQPEYEVDFYARLYLAQVTEISKSKDIASARKSFKRLLRDSKNRDFKDKIYYEMGVFEYKQKNIDQMIAYLNQSIRIGNNKRVDGEAFLRLGEMYYDSKKFENSQAYYDSAVNALPKDYENLEGIKKRKQILDEFVKHLKTVRWQDSLLTMASMDTAALRTHIASIVNAREKAAEVKKKKKSNRITIEQSPGSIFNTETNTEQDESGAWYFANPSAMSLGQSEFTRVWGTIALEDNWRRSQRTSTQPQASSAENQPTTTQPGETVPAEVAADPVKTAFTNILKELPDTQEKKEVALTKIEEAYYYLGDIYSLQLLEPENGITTYNSLLKRFPESKYEAEVLYRLYVLTKDTNTVKAQEYAEKLKQKYPDSSWAKILQNPDYLTEAGKTVVRQKALYAVAYENYILEKYDTANLVLNQAIVLGSTTFNSQLLLLQIMIKGKTNSQEEYIEELKRFSEKCPEGDLLIFAKKLLENASKVNGSVRTNTVNYVESKDSKHVYVTIYSPDSALEKALIQALEVFNKSNAPQQNLTISNSELKPEKSMCVVSEFSDRSSAIAYIRLFNEKLATMNNLKNYNFNNFVISLENLEILKRTQTLNEYLIFYTKHYQTENQ